MPQPPQWNSGAVLAALLAGCGGGGGGSPPPPIQPEPPRPPPVMPEPPDLVEPDAHWPFAEGSGAETEEARSGAMDHIGFVFNTGRYKPASDPDWRSGGVVGNCLRFDGYSTRVESGALQADLAGGFTVSAWVAPHAFEFGHGGKLSGVVGQYDGAGRRGFVFGLYRHGRWGLHLGYGADAGPRDYLEETNLLPVDEWSHIAAVYDAARHEVVLYLNGIASRSFAADTRGFAPTSGEPVVLGRHPHGDRQLGVFPFHSFSGLMDEVRIHATALDATQVQALVAADLGDAGVAPEVTFEQSWLAPGRLDGDKHRPQFHLIPDSHWMNEPHAPFHYNGRYHLFYQSNPHGPFFNHIHWGHWVSEDMLRWRELPLAIRSGNDDLSPDGIAAGSATLDADGDPVLLFTALNGAASPGQRIALARPADLSDPDLVRWNPHPAPVMTQQRDQGRFGEFRDPFVFPDPGGGRWYALITSGIPGGSGTALVYDSTDLLDWTYRGPLFSVDIDRYPQVGTVWELPVMLLLGPGSDGRERHILMINAVGGGKLDVYYWIGVWNNRTYRFTPDDGAPQVLDLGEGFFTGPSGLVDTTAGTARPIVFSIAQGVRMAMVDATAGWAHNGGMPIQLSLAADDTIRLRPIDEVATLRGEMLIDRADLSVADARIGLAAVRGDSLEIELALTNLDPSNPAQQASLIVRRSPTTGEMTRLSYIPVTGRFLVDRTRSSIDPDVFNNGGVQGGLVPGEPAERTELRLRAFIDRSLIEAYVNGRRSLTTRAFPAALDALEVDLNAPGAVRVASLRVWRMNPIRDDAGPAGPGSFRTDADTWTSVLTNHDFATGDLTGWTVEEGNAFTPEGVTREAIFWDRHPFNASGRIPGGHHFWGFRNLGDGATGRMRSESFILGGSGEINFLIAGGHDIDNLYVALVRESTGEEVLKSTGTDFEQYFRVFWDASEWLGERMHIRVVDRATGGFGHVNIDDVHVPGTIAP